MKGKLITIGVLTAAASLIAFAPMAVAQEKTAPAGTVVDNRTSSSATASQAGTQSASNTQQIAADSPSRWLESVARGDKDSLRGKGIPEKDPCLTGGHYYERPVVNSVPSSCFLGNSGPGAFGIAF